MYTIESLWEAGVTKEMVREYLIETELESQQPNTCYFKDIIANGGTFIGINNMTTPQLIANLNELNTTAECDPQNIIDYLKQL